jgi:gag-polypeptide of LTR copia-type
MDDFDKITKLNHESWNTWSKLIRAHLTIKGVFDPIEKEKPLQILLPAGDLSAAQRATADAEILKREQEIAGWIEAVKLATMYMTLSVSADQLIHFVDENSSKATWNLLKSNNTNHSRGSKMHKLETVLNTKFHSGSNMREHAEQVMLGI